jgi:hypothetical protein
MEESKISRQGKTHNIWKVNVCSLLDELARNRVVRLSTNLMERGITVLEGRRVKISNARWGRNLVLNIDFSSLFQKIKNKWNATDWARAMKCCISRLTFLRERVRWVYLIPDVDIGALLEEKGDHREVFLVAIIM